MASNRGFQELYHFLTCTQHEPDPQLQPSKSATVETITKSLEAVCKIKIKNDNGLLVVSTFRKCSQRTKKGQSHLLYSTSHNFLTTCLYLQNCIGWEMENQLGNWNQKHQGTWKVRLHTYGLGMDTLHVLFVHDIVRKYEFLTQQSRKK